MAQITITIPDALVPKVLAAFRFRWPELEDMTGAAAGKEGVARSVREVYKQASTMIAQQSADGDIAAEQDTIT